MMSDLPEQTGQQQTRVRLPDGAKPPYGVFLNGVPQTEGTDFRVDGMHLIFDQHLEKEGKLGFMRWLSMALSIAGTYKQNDSVDVTYSYEGKQMLVTGLDIEPKNGQDSASAE